MSTKKRRQHTPDNKVSILRLHLLKKKPISEVCEAHRIVPTLFYRWQKELFENGAAAFRVGKASAKDTRDDNDRITELERKIVDRDEGLARLMMEHVKLKKTYWPALNGSWVEPDLRDEVVDFVVHWCERYECIHAKQILSWLGLSAGKFHEWKNRYGQGNFHNGKVPRDYWLLPEEKEKIIRFYLEHQLDGYRRCTYRMIDSDIVCCSPSTVYRTLAEANVLRRCNRKPSGKGKGFDQPTAAHEHWHIDIRYVNIASTFYYLIVILDGFSRFIVHWDLRESMQESDVQLLVQGARELYAHCTPRIISDNGKQLTGQEFKEWIRFHGMTHLTASPYCLQSNGTLERVNETIKTEYIRPGSPLSLADAKRMVGNDVLEYNEKRLHSAIGYVTPKDKLEGRAEAIHQARDEKLEQARQNRKMIRLRTMNVAGTVGA